MKPKRKTTIAKKWYQGGKAPDYRFSLANERTFLAWIRTALALLAGALGIHQFVESLSSPFFRDIIATFLSAGAGAIAVYAYCRWADNEKAMRHGRELRYTPFLKLISFVTLLLAAILVYLILF